METSEGQKIRASKEVNLSTGAIGSPEVLLHSGIGPREQLQNLGIDVISDLEGVGKNLKDHAMATITLLLKANSTAADLDSNAKDATNDVGTPMPSAYLSPPAILAS